MPMKGTQRQPTERPQSRRESTMSITPKHIEEATQLGRDAGLAAASWIIDGNTKREFIPAVLALMDDGDPRADEYLPAMPNLSGEWSDDPTPDGLARDILGDTCPQCGNAGTFIG